MVLLECKTEKRNSHVNTGSQWSKQEACFTRATQMWLAVNHNTRIKFDVRSVLHGQVSMAAVNQIYVIHHAMNGCKNLKNSLKDCFENVNIRSIFSCIHYFVNNIIVYTFHTSVHL